MGFADNEIVQKIWNWIKLPENYIPLIVSAAVVLISLILLIIIVRVIKRLENRNKLTENYSRVLIRIFRFIFFLIFLFSILIAFNITVGAITAAIALLGGTILGFAAINTIGNALAGLIIMISKPIHIGDRLFFKEQYADVLSVELIYTKLRKLDKAIIVIPNQQLLNTEIINYGKNEQIRRSNTITVDFSIESKIVEKALFEAIKGIEGILETPEPKVSLTEIQNFAAEYTLFYSIKNVQDMFSISSQVRKNILKTAKKYKIDLRTPTLVQNLK
ncbi:MAG: mechanosensitive ion channel [Asgard group archaeon]|nr:mechanosensitive ion channel [Asgard group archaeon]